MYLDNYRNKLVAISKAHNVDSLYAFGSVLTDRFNDKSDVDFVVDIKENDPLKYGEMYFNLKFALEDLFQRQIDLLEKKVLHNEYLCQHIDNSKQLIYAN